MADMTVLPDGLRLVTQPVPHCRSAALGLWFAAGTRDEAAERPGTAHFLEHAVFKATARRPTSLALANEVERWGGDLNAETCKEYTGYTARLPAEHWETGLDVLVDMATAPLLRAADVEAEGLVIAEEIK